jgi:hypothetical protein
VVFLVTLVAFVAIFPRLRILFVIDLRHQSVLTGISPWYAPCGNARIGRMQRYQLEQQWGDCARRANVPSAYWT